MTDRTQKESEAVYNASRNNIYYNLLLDLRDLGYKPKELVEITGVNTNTLRGLLYKNKESAPQSGLNSLIETLLNYFSVLVLLSKSNKNQLLSKIEDLMEQLKSMEDGIQLSLTEADIEEKVDQIAEDMESLSSEMPTVTSTDFTEGIPGSTAEAPFGLTAEGKPRKIPPRKTKRRRR